MSYCILRYNGVYIFDENANLIEKIDLRLSSEDLLQIQKGKIPKNITSKIPKNSKFLCQKFEGFDVVENTVLLRKALSKIKEKDYVSLQKKIVEVTSKLISESVTRDLLLVQAIEMLDDLNRTINILIERFREWYEYYFPEISQRIEDHEKFVQTVLNKDRKDLMKKMKIKHTMGGNLEKKDVEMLNKVAERIHSLYKLRLELKKYINELMEEIAPNVKEIAGATIGARLISLAGGLKELANLPSSTIQVLGAEKALFAHLTKGTPCPKHGVLFNHPLIQKLPKKKRGAMARTLASKILIAAKVDAFSPGKIVYPELKKALEERFKQLKEK